MLCYGLSASQDPAKFLELQIQAYLKTVTFQREIDEVQKAASGRGVGGVQTSRIASEANREYIFSSSFTGDKHIQTYLDENGRFRVSRLRAMGMRMTRDIQRNLDMMKEIEQERTYLNMASKSSTVLSAENNAGLENSGNQLFVYTQEKNLDLVRKNVQNEHLVGGNSGEIFNVDDTAAKDLLSDSDSDCDWEEGKEGIIEVKNANFRGENKVELKSSIVDGDNNDESEVKWEEGDCDGAKSTLLSPAQSEKAASRGCLEEESDLQKAIRRSLESIGNGELKHMSSVDERSTDVKVTKEEKRTDINESVSLSDINENIKPVLDSFSKGQTNDLNIEPMLLAVDNVTDAVNTPGDLPAHVTEVRLEEEMRLLGQEYINLENEQRKLERNAESVNSALFTECQELLQMFGLPYIIAPMEAEDIEKELGLTREKLVRMALLLGSDYTEGVSETVISAYYSPQVDKSTELFTWGKPDHLVLRKLNCGWKHFTLSMKDLQSRINSFCSEGDSTLEDLNKNRKNERGSRVEPVDKKLDDSKGTEEGLECRKTSNTEQSKKRKNGNTFAKAHSRKKKIPDGPSAPGTSEMENLHTCMQTEEQCDVNALVRNRSGRGRGRGRVEVEVEVEVWDSDADDQGPRGNPDLSKVPQEVRRSMRRSWKPVNYSLIDPEVEEADDSFDQSSQPCLHDEPTEKTLYDIHDGFGEAATDFGRGKESNDDVNFRPCSEILDEANHEKNSPDEKSENEVMIIKEANDDFPNASSHEDSEMGVLKPENTHENSGISTLAFSALPFLRKRKN
ncbi:hypothetical protein RIF29_14606 [Crotalaria pallida]|uniref:Uncharacterized protein n=1 Tax=Crotalaria pallida TaxID=3830 RepID=A0AAN9IDX0_CROPI